MKIALGSHIYFVGAGADPTHPGVHKNMPPMYPEIRNDISEALCKEDCLLDIYHIGSRCQFHFDRV